MWTFLLSAAVLAAMSWVAFIGRRRRAYLVVGWSWYLVALLPVIGLVQVGGQSHADRYTYVPLIGIFVMIAWSIPAKQGKSQVVSIAVAVLALVALIVPLRAQIEHWQDDRSLAAHTLQVTGPNEIAHLMLGNVALDDGDFAAAADHFEAATHLQPNWADAHNNLGNAAAYLGQAQRAMAAYRRAIQLQPDLADAHYNLGVLLHAMNQLEDAIAELHAAIRLQPDHQPARVQLGAVLRDAGHLEDAAEQLETAVRLEPNDPIALMNLADVQARLGRISDARTNFEHTIQLAELGGFDDLRDQAKERLSELPND
jgi:tetratricopeptide (TPR) repeat protein